MLITESKLKQIVREELQNLLEEEQLDEIDWKKLGKRAVGAAAGLAALGGVYKAGLGGGTAGMKRDIPAVMDTGERSSEETPDDSEVTRTRAKYKIKKIGSDKEQKPTSGKKINKVNAKDKSFYDAVKALKDSPPSPVDVAVTNSGLSTGMKTAAKKIYGEILYNVGKENQFFKALKWANKSKFKTEEEKDIQFAYAIRSEFGQDSKMFRTLAQRYKSMYGSEID